MSWPFLAVLLVIAILGVILWFQRGSTIVSAPASTSTELDEAQLAALEYPGSTVVPQVEMSVQEKPGVPVETHTRALWTEAEPELVRTWFRDWMSSHGWKVDPMPARISSLIAKEATRLPADSAADVAGLHMDGFIRGKAKFTLMVFAVTAGSLLAGAELPATARTVYSTTYATGRR
jgi:hypothetical protein